MLAQRTYYCGGLLDKGPSRNYWLPAVLLFLFLFWEVVECLGIFLSPHLGFRRTIVLERVVYLGGGWVAFFFLCFFLKTVV